MCPVYKCYVDDGTYKVQVHTSTQLMCVLIISDIWTKIHVQVYCV